MEEIWKDIEGYEGIYQVSNLGRVKSLERVIVRGNGATLPVPKRILKSAKNKDGYQLVNLWKEGNRKRMYVHRLVAQAFLPNPDDLPQVNHKDENPSNNHVDNLEFCTADYNTNYGTRNERIAEKQSKPVLQYTLDGSFVREWLSTMEARRNGYNIGNICNCCNGKLNRYKGYIWKYKEDTSS